MKMINRLIEEMISYYSGDPKRIQHFIKVHAFAKLIGETENLTEKELFTLETAAVVHDIGIKISEEKYGSCTGSQQETEGPTEAEKMLKKLGFESETVKRVCWLVGHHHTYSGIDSPDHQILVEADFLVNLYEDRCSEKSVLSAYEKIFRTETGKRLCKTMFGIK
ncbi:MAG: HD domain-containing protein [Oscillospiraceae bacterium]|nr:HD domain-containing protein [Oscillospiraceae bacterium]